jgi:hypothetical protein
MEITSDLKDKSNIKTTTFDLKKDLDLKQKKLDYDLSNENYKKFYNDIEYKTQLLNIDSRYRNKIPKNVYKSTNDILPNDPIIVTRDSNIVQITYPNHSFLIGDSIIIQNINTKSKILSNSVYFFNHVPYMFINYTNHEIPLDFINYYNEYKISIQIINDLGIKTKYSNIPINLITQIYNITLPSLVDKITPIIPEVYKVFNVNNATDMDANYLMIELPYPFLADSGNYYISDDVFKFTFLNIGGIPLYYINADYPVNYNRYQGYHEIINIDQNNIYFSVPISASSTINEGGTNLQVMLITNTINGFPNSNKYTIDLKRSFNNVVRIELVSTEFPYIDFLIRAGINNKLYWQHLDDGNYIYQTSIPEGNYDSTSLISTLTKALNNVPRFYSTKENLVYNIFTINLDQYTQEIIFTPYKNNNLPNSLSATLVEINNVKYVKLTVLHPGNLVEVGDTITITGATKIGTVLDTSYLNTTLTIYEVNTTNQTYTILIAPLNQITNSTIVDLTGNGGPSIVIKTKAKVKFLFNKSDTIGTILGFKDVGQPNAITQFKTSISNFDSYIQSTNLNQVGNLDLSTRLLNFTGSNYYILMYINDYECVINNSNQPTAFAKILLSGNPGDVLFNTFVNYPLEFDFPISILTELSISFTYPDGTLVDFRNIDHSFTLRIIERTVKPYGTGLNSKDTSYYETVKQHENIQ